MKKQNILSRTDAVDRLLFRPLIGIPFFFAVMSLVFFLSFRGIGGRLSDALEAVFLRWGTAISEALLRRGVSALAVRFAVGGIYTAVTSAAAFLPQTAVFFLFIKALDDCGYLARAVFVTDRFFRIFGLSGSAVIPFLLGYGCAVSAVPVSGSEKSEQAVLRALPFVPCNARLPVILFLADSFFPAHKTLAALLILALSFLLILLTLLLSPDKKDAPSLIVGLPSYRVPRPRVLVREAAEKSKEYLSRAMTAVLLSCAVFSALAMLTPDLRPTENVRQSVLFAVSEKIAVIFRPLGFDQPEAAAALCFGFFAKENIIGVLGIMTKSSLRELLSPSAALSFTAFCAFYTPCVFLLAAVRKKAGRRSAILLFLRTLSLAYALSLVLYAFHRVIAVYCLNSTTILSVFYKYS